MRRPIVIVLAALAVLSSAVATSVSAQDQLPKFYVYGEDDAPADMRTCRITHAAAIGEVKAELRAAGIVIQDNSSDPEAVMDTYLNISAMTISSDTKFCTYNIEINFESFGDVTNPFTGANEFTKLTYCSKGSLLVWDKAGAQAAINAKLRGYVRECISKYKGRGSR